MSYLIIDLTANIRRLAAGLSRGSGRKNREIISELISVEQRIGEHITDLEMQTQLWYLWVLLEEINTSPPEYFEEQWEQYQRLITQIQSQAFRVGQRWAHVSRLKPARPAYQRADAIMEPKRVYRLLNTKGESPRP